MPKYCPNCGVKLAEKAKYCSECGSKIETAETSTPEVPTAETQVVEKSSEPKISTSPKQSGTRSSQKHTSFIMLFVFGAILLISGMWLFSFTDTVPHYEIISGFKVQRGWDTIHPYQIPAGVLAVFGVCILFIAWINSVVTEKQARTEGIVQQIKEVADDKGKTPSFQTIPEKSPIQIENIKLTKTDGRAFFVLEIRNVSNETATKVEVTPPFGSPTIIDLPDGVLKPDQTTKYTTTLVGDYYVGNTYVIIVKAFYSDGTTLSVVVSVRCAW